MFSATSERELLDSLGIRMNEWAPTNAELSAREHMHMSTSLRCTRCLLLARPRASSSTWRLDGELLSPESRAPRSRRHATRAASAGSSDIPDTIPSRVAYQCSTVSPARECAPKFRCGGVMGTFGHTQSPSKAKHVEPVDSHLSETLVLLVHLLTVDAAPCHAVPQVGPLAQKKNSLLQGHAPLCIRHTRLSPVGLPLLFQL